MFVRPGSLSEAEFSQTLGRQASMAQQRYLHKNRILQH
jgi:hypothetical protein